MAKKSKKIKVAPQVVSGSDPQMAASAPAPGSRLARDWVWTLLLMLTVILAYLPVWHAGFIWDDDTIVTANPAIVGPLGLKEIWTTSQARFYPLVLSTFWLEHALWGLAPLPFHLVTVFFHATSAVMLWRILRNLDVHGAWLGAALWALHPVQVESVAWVSEMKNTESCVFYLLTILFFVRGLKTESPGNRSGGGWNYGLALLCAGLAMLSKSSTLLLPVVLALCAWWVKGRWSWRDMAKVVPFLLLCVVIGVLVKQVSHLNEGDELHWAQSWQERVAMTGYIFWFYLGKLIWPPPLLTYYSFWKIETGQWLSYWPSATVVLVLIILWLKRQKWSGPCFFAFAYYLIMLLPVMGLFSMTGFRYSIVEDHLQYLASMGPLALAGAGLARLSDFAIPRRHLLRAALCAALLLMLGMLSWRQSSNYQTEKTLWTYNLARNPMCWAAYNGLGFVLGREGNTDASITLLQKALEIDSNYAVTHFNLGMALTAKGRLDDAIAEYQTAMALDPSDALAHVKLAEVFFQRGHVDEAIAQYQKAIEMNPLSTWAYNGLGLVLVQKGQVDDAIKQYQKALEIDPGFALAHNNLGVALFQNGQVADAITHYQKALEIDPTVPQAHTNLGLALAQTGVAFLQQGDVDKAITQFHEALKNDPAIVQAHSDLGIAFAQKGQADEALAQFQEALRLRPDDTAAQVNLAKIKAMMQQKAGSQ